MASQLPVEGFSRQNFETPFLNLRGMVFSKGVKMQIKNSKTGGIISWMLFFLMILTSCQGLQTTVEAQDRIPLLEGGPHTGTWESNDVSLEYQYIAQEGAFKLNIGGSAERKYDQLSVWIKFLDAQGKVLETKSVFNSGFRVELSRDKGAIEKTFDIPAGSTQFAFQSMLKERLGR
jgi:hypothetical protein